MLYPPLRNVIGGLTFSQLIVVLKNLTSSESVTYESLTLACQNKVCASLFFLFCMELLGRLLMNLFLTVRTVAAVCSAVPRGEAAVLWCPPRTQHR